MKKNVAVSANMPVQTMSCFFTCNNEDSEYYTDYTEYDYGCDYFEPKE